MLKDKIENKNNYTKGSEKKKVIKILRVKIKIKIN
jgi:hypothetical protein